MSGASTLDVVREVQIPLIAALLIGAFAAKAGRTVASRPAGRETGPTAMLPLRLRRPAALALCASELALGAGLLLTAGRLGAGTPALVVRVATMLLFGTATAALHELRGRRPDAGCGCFGELSRTPVSWRVITRAALLWAAALASIGARPLRMPDSAGQAWLILGVAAAELALLAALSPEVGQVVMQLSHTDPCEVREVPVERTLSALRGSWPWRQLRPFLAADVPVDVWREGCWRFAVYPASLDGRRVEVVFAVYLARRRAPVRVGILETGIDFRAGTQEDPLRLSNHV
ncbi:MAG TPA: MauE/DoxX family redox-associated membrane protein [Trebonia sp.]|nr:MauE/DoxX family redox-associated membrane protein [Trebonia sp.]